MSIDITNIYDTVVLMWNFGMSGLRDIYGYDPSVDVHDDMRSADISVIQGRWYKRGYITTIFWGDNVTLSLRTQCDSELTDVVVEEMLRIAGQAVAERVEATGSSLRAVRELIQMYHSGTVARFPQKLAVGNDALMSYVHMACHTREYLPAESDDFHQAAVSAARRLSEIANRANL